MGRSISMIVCALCWLALPATSASGDEPKYELRTATVSVRDVLTEQLGRRVTLRLDGGETLEGTVNKVGEHVVHLARLSGRDFFLTLSGN